MRFYICARLPLPRFSFFFIAVLLLAQGCAAPKSAIESAASGDALSGASLGDADGQGLRTPPVRAAIPVPAEVQELQRAQAKIAAADSSRQRERIASDSLRLKLGTLNKLYRAAVKSIEEQKNPQAKSQLDKALTLIAALREEETVEADSAFRQVAGYVLQAYDAHIQPIAELDTDNPAVALHEWLTGDVESIVVDKKMFRGIVIPKTQMPLELNDDVEKFITYYSTRGRGIVQRYLDRAAIYFPTAQKILAEVGVPPEMIYLSILESGVNPHARSRANALGMWQFMKGTGRMYGLEGNKWFDERCDVFKATRSSMRHLKDLYKIYGDWYQVLAGYNAGPGMVNRAIRLGHARDFWSTRHHYKRETQEYVPRFIALTIIGMMPEKFGFAPVQYRPPLEVGEVDISNGSLALSTIAKYTGLALDTLRFYNPELLKETTPPAYKNYKLKVPAAYLSEIAPKIAAIPASERKHYLAHKVRKGDGLPSIAKRYGASVDDIRRVNELAKSAVPVGSVLVIPTSAENAASAAYSTRDLSDDSKEKRSRRGRRRSRKTKRGKRSKVSGKKSKSVAARR